MAVAFAAYASVDNRNRVRGAVALEIGTLIAIGSIVGVDGATGGDSRQWQRPPFAAHSAPHPNAVKSGAVGAAKRDSLRMEFEGDRIKR